MIRIEDSREWVKVHYMLQSKWTPLIEDTETHDKVRAIFKTNKDIGPLDELNIKMLGSGSIESPAAEIPLSHTYRIIHTMVCNEGVVGLKKTLSQLWGTVTAVMKNDLKGETVEINRLKAYKSFKVFNP